MATPRGFVLTLLAVGLLLSLLAVPVPVSAHADFLTSTPNPYAIWNVMPSAVTVTVSEAIQPGTQHIQVTNLTGDGVEDGPAQLSPTNPAMFSVRLKPGLRPSVFTVTWAVVSADDGHFTAGTFYFMVTYRDGTLPGQFPRTGALVLDQPISAFDVALDAADFLGFAIAFGGVLFVGLLWVPVSTSLEAANQETPAGGFRALLKFARWGAFAFTLAVAGLWAENLIRFPPTGFGDLFGSTFRLALLLEMVMGAAMIALLTRILLRPRTEASSQGLPWEFLVLIFIGFAAILLEVAASHSASEQAWWPLGPIADAVHLYGAALWVGGLLAILRARPWLRAPAPPAFSRDLLAAFSRFAFLGAFLLVSAGLVLGLILVGTVDGLVGTGYGWIVLAKSSLLIPMVALGAWNRRMLRRGGAAEAPDVHALERLSRNVRLEAILGAGILVLAGLLVTVNPASAPQPQNPNFLLETTNGGLHGIFEMDPYPSTPGSYYFQLTLYFPGNGTPFLGGGNGTMTFLLAGGNATGTTLALEGPHDNHYFVQSAVLDQPGTWEVAAHVHGPTGAGVTLSFEVTIRA